MSKGDSTKAQIIIRNYIIERTLVSAMVGLDNRSTMDVDATVKNLSLPVESACKIVQEITSIPVEDGMVLERVRRAR